MSEINLATVSTASPGSILVGLDIGGTKLAAGLVTSAGKVLLEAATPTDIFQGGQSVLKRALELVESILLEGKRQDLPAPSSIGVASAGRIDTGSGRVVGASNLIPGWAGLELTGALKRALAYPAAPIMM